MKRVEPALGDILDDEVRGKTFRELGLVLVRVVQLRKAFDDLKVGDVVTVRFTESVIVQVRPDAKPTKLQDTTEAARKAGDVDVVQQQKRIVSSRMSTHRVCS